MQRQEAGGQEVHELARIWEMAVALQLVSRIRINRGLQGSTRQKILERAFHFSQTLLSPEVDLKAKGASK